MAGAVKAAKGGNVEFRAEKAGHTGTLDPLASGLLPLCFGAATKFSQASLEADKAYAATLRLGQTRVGGDMEAHTDVHAKSIRETLTRLISRPDDLAELGKRAQDYVYKHFTWDAKARQIREVYDWVLKRRATKPDWGIPIRP